MMSALSITWSRVTDAKEKAAAITLINACAIDDEAHEGEDEATYFIERFGDLDKEEFFIYDPDSITEQTTAAAEKAFEAMIGVSLTSGGSGRHYIDDIEESVIKALRKLFNYVHSATYLDTDGKWVTTGHALLRAGFTIQGDTATPPAPKP